MANPGAESAASADEDDPEVDRGAIIRPGEAYEIPPGHDGWVVGDVPWESVEFTSAHEFAKSSGDLGERDGDADRDSFRQIESRAFSTVHVNDLLVPSGGAQLTFQSLLEGLGVRVRFRQDNNVVFDKGKKPVNVSLLLPVFKVTQEYNGWDP